MWCAGLSIFTGPLYGWSGSENGLLLAVLGIASIPLSFMVGVLSPHVSDRALTASALLATLVGATLCTRAGNARDPAAYFGGGAILYMVRGLLTRIQNRDKHWFIFTTYGCVTWTSPHIVGVYSHSAWGVP